MLAKQTYWETEPTDYKVWHFNGDLPLKVHDEWGHELLICEFDEVSAHRDDEQMM